MLGEIICGVYVEPFAEECLNCPFDECTTSRAETLDCPRLRAEIAAQRDAGEIPDGMLRIEEVAYALGVCSRYAYDRMRDAGVEKHSVGRGAWRKTVYRAADIAAMLGEMIT